MELPRNQSSRKAVILTADKFEDMEVFFPVFRLIEEGWQVDVAAPDMDEMSGEHGYVLEPDKTIADVNADEYQLLIIPGGFPDGAPATVREIEEARDITRSFLRTEQGGRLNLPRAVDACGGGRREGAAPDVVLARWRAGGHPRGRRRVVGRRGRRRRQPRHVALADGSPRVHARGGEPDGTDCRGRTVSGAGVGSGRTAGATVL